MYVYTYVETPYLLSHFSIGIGYGNTNGQGTEIVKIAFIIT